MAKQLNLIEQKAKKVKPLTLTAAREILNPMHFDAYVACIGRNRGARHISWVTLQGDSMDSAFSREAPWEEIIEFARKRTPVWDRAWLFDVGDVIEFDWFYKTRVQGTIIERNDRIRNYRIQSPAFVVTGSSDKRILTNYDLKFQRKAVKVGEIDRSPVTI